ncbi:MULTISPECIES: hypothetical protein [unclassified Facklamia]|uniref:hypothetical protein n=1 Tax=Aerococcaceae TaxID=186827 RepID=UPI0013B96BB0|nr:MULTISPECIES: hypothetical protein [unclassified Facklamia]NEW64785.1 hypothetical protein [Facklamia sp. 252]NEW68107.1 hypothetical protein [Facklamia sp. 253]QQD64940.1 hypothetical protein JDW14_06300 [Aerococcaceae bacterium zg-252]
MKKSQPVSRNQTIGQTIAPRKRPKRKNPFITGFIAMIVLVILFFFAYQKYQRASHYYNQFLYQSEWQMEDEHAMMQSQPTVILTVGMAFPDAGRIQPEQAIAWQLTAINPQTKKSIQFSLSPELKIGDKTLVEYNPRKEMIQIQSQIETLINTPVQYATLYNLSHARPLFEKLQGLAIQAETNLQLDDKVITAGEETLLSTRQVLQYILHDSDETNELTAQRQIEVMDSLRKKLFDWQHFLNWQYYFEAADTAINSSITWKEFLRLSQLSWQQSLDNATHVMISTANQDEVRQQIQRLMSEE